MRRDNLTSCKDLITVDLPTQPLNCTTATFYMSTYTPTNIPSSDHPPPTTEPSSDRPPPTTEPSKISHRDKRRNKTVESAPGTATPTEATLLANIVHYALIYFDDIVHPSDIAHIIRDAFRSADDNYGAEEAEWGLENFPHGIPQLKIDDDSKHRTGKTTRSSRWHGCFSR